MIRKITVKQIAISNANRSCAALGQVVFVLSDKLDKTLRGNGELRLVFVHKGHRPQDGWLRWPFDQFVRAFFHDQIGHYAYA